MTHSASRFLRRILFADAALSGAAGLLVLVGGGLLAGPLGLPEALLRGAGAVLVPYVCFVAWTASRPAIPHAAVWAIVAANAAWAAASILVLVSGFVAPTVLGYLFVIAQAAAVAILGELQFLALRRPAAGSPA